MSTLDLNKHRAFCAGVWSLLEQSELWRTEDGRVLRLEEMEDEHRRNVMRWIDARIVRIADAAGYGACYTIGHYMESCGDMAYDALDHELNQVIDESIYHPERFVRESPLYRRLRELSPPREAPPAPLLPHEMEN